MGRALFWLGKTQVDDAYDWVPPSIKESAERLPDTDHMAIPNPLHLACSFIQPKLATWIASPSPITC